MKRFKSKKLLLILSIIFIALIMTYGIDKVIRINSTHTGGDIDQNSPVSMPLSFSEDTPDIVSEKQSEAVIETPVQPQVTPDPQPVLGTVNTQPVQSNPEPYKPTNLPYVPSVYCTPESTSLYGMIFTGNHIFIQQGESGNVYAETMHNCTNPDTIQKTWVNLTTNETMSYSNHLDLSGLPQGSYELAYITWNEDFYSKETMLVVVN